MDTTKETIIRQHVLYSTASNYGAKLITLGIWFFLTPFILHRLGQAGYGLWILVEATVSYGSLLNFGISGAVIKYVAEHRARGESQQAHSLVATALRLYSVLGLVTAVICMALAPVFPTLFNVPPEGHDTALWLVRLMGLGIGFSLPCGISTAVLLGVQRFDLNNLISVIGAMLSAVATVAVLLLGGGVLGMAAVSIAVMLFMQIPSIWLIHRIAPELRFGWRGANRSLIRTVMSFSWPLFVMDASDRLQTKSDEVVISAFLPISAVTPYAIARKLSELAQILTDQFMKVLVPLSSELHADEDHVRLRSVYITGTRLTLAIYLPVACILVILGQPILTVWVGAAYAEYAYLVTILTLASLIDTSQWPGGSVLQGMGRHRPIAVVSVGTGLANLALSMVLVQRFGLTGVALGTLLPTTVACLGLTLPYTMNVLGVRTTQVVKEVFLPVLVPVIPMVIALYLLQEAIQPLSLFSILFLTGIGTLVYMTGYLSIDVCRAERETCRSIAMSTIRLAGGYLKSM
jgi:O-antigen/teichoic acid export membrane protein